MSNISTHILDTSLGKPAAGVRVWLEHQQDGQWRTLAESQTDADGRARDLTSDSLAAGHYRLSADLGAYFAVIGVTRCTPRQLSISSSRMRRSITIYRCSSARIPIRPTGAVKRP